ncbi:MAG: GTP-binding protein, partial [Planctomycetota bacterium]
LTLQAVICLVDPQDAENPRIQANPVFHDQLEMADIVVINHTDHRSAEAIAHCRALVEQLDPPKLLIAETSHGQLQPHWLTLSGSVIRTPRFPDAHGARHPGTPEQSGAAGPPEALVQLGPPPASETALQSIPARPAPGQPLQFPSSGSGWYACGWLFAPEDLFHRESLLELLESWPGIQRLKGVFHCKDDWWSINRAGREASFRRSCWRRDSRLEIITDRPLNWEEITSHIGNCKV